eukprot:gene7965-9497_t
MSHNYFDVSPENIKDITTLMTEEGYVQLDNLTWDLPVESMVQLIDKLHALGLPITFCYLFDEFWSIFSRLHLSIEGVLGKNYQRLPDFWAWRVDPAKTRTTKHCLRMERLKRVRDRLGAYWEDIAPKIRALPVPVGGALIWNQMVWHWGSQSNKRGTHPRYSVAMEFQAAPTKHPVNLETEAAPTISGESANSPSSNGQIDKSNGVEGEGSDNIAYFTRTTGDDWEFSDEHGDTVPVYNHPLSHPLELFSFEDRLKLIAKQLLQYRGMYPLSDEMRQIAEELSTL